ncbi:MAG TPA: hypothetical protein VLH40_05725 [Atribacteraceae bacterium]|nr:hypothetical protein [Atribacteraceae bacterium]
MKNIWIAYSETIFDEREKALYQARNNLKGKTLSLIEEALTDQEYQVGSLNMDQPIHQFVESLDPSRVDLVFNLAVKVSEIYDQAFLPSLLDATHIPYLGSNSTVHSLCLDRSLIKLSLRGIGIPSPSSFLLLPDDPVPESQTFPVIIKPRFRTHFPSITSDSVANDLDELMAKIQALHKLTREKVLIEKYLEGREMVIGLWGNGKQLSMLPILEVRHENSQVLQSSVKDVFCPADLNEEQKTMLETMVIRIFNELNMRDYASFHLIFNQKENIPFFFEINSLPLLYYKYSAFPQMCQAGGIDYKDMIRRLLTIAEERVGGRHDN